MESITALVTGIIAFVQTNWVAMVAALWALEQFLRIIAPLTPWDWDDNIVTMFGSLLAKWFPKK